MGAFARLERGSTLYSLCATYLVLAGLYVLAMIWVWTGILHTTGGHYVTYATLLAVGFVCAAAVAYFFLLPLLRPVAEIDFRAPGDAIATSLAVVIAGLAVVHWLALGRIPVLAAYETSDQMQAALIRDSIVQTGIPFLNYIPMVIIRSVAPFLGIYFISRRRYGRAWIAMIIGLLYGISLMQKSYPLLTLVPPAFYCLLTRRFVRMLVIAALAMAGVMLSFFAAAPSYRPIKTAVLFHAKPLQHQPSSLQGPAPKPHPAPTPELETELLPAQNGQSVRVELPQQPPPVKNLMKIAEVSATSLGGRVFFLPGKVVADWFSIFPRRLPYEKGCGYRFVSPFLGCAFENAPSRLYAIFYPENVAAGVHGTYNAAHFAEEYANFGPTGLLLSGIFAAVVLSIAVVTTARAGLAAAAALNFASIMALTSTALHTTLLSGGWMLMMAFTFLLYRPLRTPEAFGETACTSAVRIR